MKRVYWMLCNWTTFYAGKIHKIRSFITYELLVIEHWGGPYETTRILIWSVICVHIVDKQVKRILNMNMILFQRTHKHICNCVYVCVRACVCVRVHVCVCVRLYIPWILPPSRSCWKVFLPPDFVESNIAVISSMDDSFKGSTGNTYIKNVSL